MLLLIALLGAAGLGLSIYSWYVEQKIKSDPTFKPFCDISDVVSCSKPLMSKYRAIFFISNPLLGIGFYLLIILLALAEYKTALMYSSTAGVLASFIFAYILFAKIRSICIVCTAIYIVNLALFLASYYYYA
jgi:uncharacterized membrane protein